MNIVTIMNYEDMKNVKMCAIFIDRLKRFNPDCNLYILYNESIDKKLVKFAGKYDHISFHKKPVDNECWVKHHNVNFKLYNLTNLNEPFIFLDSDIFCFSSLDHLWNLKDSKPFISIDHQLIPGHTDNIPYKFINSGVQVVGDPDWYQYDMFREAYAAVDGRLMCPGFDQAHIFTYSKLNNYDYTHADIGYEWNSCAKYGDIDYTDNEWICTYNGPSREGESTKYDVKLNHYWWDFKPWNINCPVWNSYE